MDMQRKPSLVEYRKCLESLSLNVPVFEVDARSAKDVTMLIQALLFSLDPGVVN
jgi:hypothetical protein